MPLVCFECGEKIDKVKKVFDDELRELVKEGLDAREMAYRLNVKTSVIYKVLAKIGAKKVYRLPEG